MLAWFGPVPYAFETPYSQQVFRVAGTFFTAQSVIIILVSTVTIALLYAFMTGADLLVDGGYNAT